MNIKDWLSEHSTHLAVGGSGGAGGAAIFFVMFRDAIKDGIVEWKKGRDEARAERAAMRAIKAAEASGGDKSMNRLITLLEEDIKAQRANEKEVVTLLGQMATSHERTLDVQRQTSNQLNDFDRRLGELRVAVQTRFQ